MVVILQEQKYDAWLQAPAPDSPQFLRQFPAEGLAVQAPEGPGAE